MSNTYKKSLDFIKEDYFSAFQIERVKREIDKLICNTKSELEKENQFLKQKIDSLIRENTALKNELYFNREKSLKHFFTKHKKSDYLS